MAKKKRVAEILPEPPAPWPKWKTITIAAAIVIACAVGAIVVITLLGGGSISKQTPKLDIPDPAGPIPEFARSSAADVLAKTSFSDMSTDELELVKSETTRVYADGQFRTDSSLAQAVDVFRLHGVTRVIREYQNIATPGGTDDLTVSLIFYCDDATGKLNQYRYKKSSFGITADATQVPTTSEPFGGTLSGLDWSHPEDLGFRTIQGRRVHGVGLPYTIPGTGTVLQSETWFDVEDARIIARKQTASSDSDQPLRMFDWRRPQPVVIPPGQQAAPCAEAFYDAVPSARPTASASPQGAATADTADTPAAAATPTP